MIGGGLPGDVHELPKGATCDDHPDRLAVTRKQGETDSFGYEAHDLCEECLREWVAYARSENARTGKCDWCKKDTTDLRDARDYEEGFYGPVYRVCGGCLARRDKEAQDWLNTHCDWDDGPDWDDDALSGASR